MRPGTHEPEAGQTWSLTAGRHGRYEITIQRFGKGPDGRLRAFGVTGGGKQTSVDLRTLRRGLRGARLERYADGTPAPPPHRPEHAPRAVREWTPTVRTFAPRGAPKRAELTKEEAKILELRGKGMSRRAIGERMGLNEEQVHTRERNAREILTMQRLRAAS